jgi:hypothetical protein
MPERRQSFVKLAGWIREAVIDRSGGRSKSWKKKAGKWLLRLLGYI